MGQPKTKFVLKSRAAWGAWSPVIATILATSGLGEEWFGQLELLFESLLGLVGAVAWGLHHFKPDGATISLKPTGSALDKVGIVFLMLLVPLLLACTTYIDKNRFAFNVGNSSMKIPIAAGQDPDYPPAGTEPGPRCGECDMLIITGGEMGDNITSLGSTIFNGILTMFGGGTPPPTQIFFGDEMMEAIRNGAPVTEPEPEVP